MTGTRGSCLADNRGRFVAVRGGGFARVWFFRRDVRGYQAMLTAFRAAMARGTAVEMDGVAGRADLAIVLAAYCSIDERRPVDLHTPAFRARSTPWRGPAAASSGSRC